MSGDDNGGRKKVNITGLKATQVAKDNYYAASTSEVEQEQEQEQETRVFVEDPKGSEDQEAQEDVETIQETQEVLEVVQNT